jgi:hypothetical protein
MNAELVFSILKGVTKFAKVDFDADGLSNPEFFSEVTGKIVPDRDNEKDVSITFTKLKINKPSTDLGNQVIPRLSNPSSGNSSGDP